MPKLERLSKPEIFKVVEYIGSQRGSGYLGNFSYASHAEFYPQYCDLDIDPYEYEGTTRDRFIAILSTVDGLTQAKIIEGILIRFPVVYFSENERAYKQRTYDELKQIVLRLEELNPIPQDGFQGWVQNLIFAANGPKPEIILADATVNRIKIVKHAEHCLIYDRAIGVDGLLWSELVSWWRDLNALTDDPLEVSRKLYKRLLDSLANEPEKLLFKTYFKLLHDKLGDKLPALLPQVYLHYDPFSLEMLGGVPRLPRQRMDFLLLLPNRIHVVVEIDGKQHYSDNDRVSPKKYAEMVAADREIKLIGYQIFRFGGYEFVNKTNAEKLIEEFFFGLFKFYSVGN